MKAVFITGSGPLPEELQRMLGGLPPELQDLFGQMTGSVVVGMPSMINLPHEPDCTCPECQLNRLMDEGDDMFSAAQKIDLSDLEVGMDEISEAFRVKSMPMGLGVGCHKVAFIAIAQQEGGKEKLREAFITTYAKFIEASRENNAERCCEVLQAAKKAAERIITTAPAFFSHFGLLNDGEEVDLPCNCESCRSKTALNPDFNFEVASALEITEEMRARAAEEDGPFSVFKDGLKAEFRMNKDGFVIMAQEEDGKEKLREAFMAAASKAADLQLKIAGDHVKAETERVETFVEGCSDPEKYLTKYGLIEQS